ncbi:Bardet-Biedl syndrome 1 protein homolog [Scaptodrosophila lebanonensis]|uniref:Bardet-Biedl syndrome 1 protein homolog n=1 Tax=Drosophila lebanonensis TaxID=7225 RepID=A0A6J2UE87_DROLE|nr:Bardet-Biedl syndrome 1 protein homolog [Scaptodrosophila lebanonensis]
MATSGTTAPNWLNVDTEDEMPKLTTLSSCMALSDVQCDGYVRLLAADISLEDDEPSARLKVFRGLRLKQEQLLPGIPAAIESLYIDETEPKTPVIAVAIAESVLFFRHMKPYFKFTIPALEVDDLELEVWRQLPVMPTKRDALLDSLRNLEHAKLSRKSQKLLQLSEEERESFISTHADSPVGRHGNIVAMCCLKRVSSDANPPSHLVLATDTGDILILEPQGFNLVYQARTCAYETTPSLLSVQGTFETDFSILVGTRNGGVYLLRKSTNEGHGQEVFKISSPLTGLLMLPIDQTIVVTTMEHFYQCYSKRGKLLYQVQLNALPVCILSLTLSHFGITLLAIALQGGVVQFYLQRYLVDEFVVSSTVAAMLYGRMGMEDHVLTLVTQENQMFVKILRRLARFEPKSSALSLASKTAAGRKKNGDVSILDKPKKSSIFVEQAVREKQHAKATYGSFQVELWRLRHTAARATIDAINSSETSISGDLTHAPVKLAAEVCGTGPAFRLYLTVQNLSSFKMASNLVVLLHADRRHYTIQQSMARLPSVLPGVPLRVDFEVVAVLDPIDKLPPATLTLDNAQIRVMLLKSGQAKPLIAAAVSMPQSEAAF